MTLIGLVLVVALSLAVAVLGWWTVTRVDDQAESRQLSLARVGLEEQVAKLPIEQDSSAIWDDAVRAVRVNDGPWMAENLVEWMSQYYGQDWVYVLDPQDHVVRAAEAGALATVEAYQRNAGAIAPLVVKLRRTMAEASAGSSESTEAATGLGESDFVELPNQTTAIISVRPILPSTPAVTQAAGTEYLLVSVKLLGPILMGEIAQKFGLEDLIFSGASQVPSGWATLPVRNYQNRILGFLNWKKDSPGTEIVREIGPVLVGVGLVGISILALLVLRLRRTSNELQLSESQAQFLAFHDPLTGIPNRALFEDRLERALASVRRSGPPIALHYLDLDRFKNVNDTLGHLTGDLLIREVANRLGKCVRDVDTVARLGGDEFAIIQMDATNDRSAESLCAAIVEALGWPFDLKGDEVSIGVSIGVVLSSQSDCTPQDMMRKADIALYGAKANGRGRYNVFAGDMDHVVQRRRAIERELRVALADNSQLRLDYQPLFDIDGRGIVGAEALIRWSHPVHGLMSPDMFIGIAEERGLIDALGIWVLRNACTFALKADLPWIAVNFSPAQFYDENLPERILLILSELEFPPDRLEIEITEGLLLQNSSTVQATLARLRAAGIRIALDDFGTGYSSITYLRTYRIDKLKIDKSFVEQIGGAETASIVKAIIELAKAMGMEVAAEGVETVVQHDILREMGCTQLQGYLFSKPVPAERLINLLQTNWPKVGGPALITSSR